TSQVFSGSAISWSTSTGQFTNYASTAGLTSAATSAEQSSSPDRALGARQTGSFGDPGAAFNYAFSTSGQTVDSVSLDLMLLDVQGRSTTWSIQFGSGAAPTSFTTLGTWSDPGTWGTTTVTYSGTAVSGMSNLANGVFRVVALTSSAGSNNRDSMGIDNFWISTLNSGTASAQLGISSAGAATYSGNVSVSGTAELTAVSGGTATFSGIISGSSGAISKTGAGTVVLSGLNTYGGGVNVSAGTLMGTTDSLKGPIANSAALVFDQATTGTFSGVVSGTGSFATIGTGTVALTSPQSFTGPTTVSAGALALSGSASLASSLITLASGGVLDVNQRTNGMTLGSGQTLAGTGSASGLIVVGNNATVSPGNSPGTLNAGSMEFAAGGNYNWQVYDLNGPAGTGWDFISGTGSLDITAGTGAGQRFNINLWSLSGISPDVSGTVANFNKSYDYRWKLAEFAGGITGFSAEEFLVKVAAANGTGGFANDITIDGVDGTFSVAQCGGSFGTVNQLYIVYAAAPEPSTLMLAGLGLAAAGWATRRRRADTPRAA
ncbi:MAG: beta strand repeat-containing protein, partial [Planctomycetaceae bacterium]